VEPPVSKLERIHSTRERAPCPTQGCHTCNSARDAGGRTIFSLLGWAISLVLLVLGALGLPGLFFLMAVESFGIPPLPGEIILAFSGVLIVDGAPYFDWPSVVAVALAGSVAGSFLAYELARWGGPGLLERWGGRVGLAPREIESATRFLARHGEVTVFIARLIPLVRAYISYPAGVARMDRGRFCVFTSLGALPFTILMVYLGVLLGENLSTLSQYYGWLEILVAVIVAVLLGLYLWRHKGR
jgi:membrane protein DedA with SNARE-associated domain